MTSTITPNRTRLIHLAEWVGAQRARKDLGLPSQWDQVFWLRRVNGELQEETGCGTACCIAGKVALEDGGIPLASEWDADTETEVPIGRLEKARVGASGEFVRFKPRGSAVRVNAYAQEVLGLDDTQAEMLFDAANNYDTIIDTIRNILNGDL